MDIPVPSCIEHTPLAGVATPECLDDVVMQMESLSSPDAYDIASNHVVADYLLCVALTMVRNEPNTYDVSVNNVIEAFNRIKKHYE